MARQVENCVRNISSFSFCVRCTSWACFFFFQFYWHKVRKNQKEEDPGQTGQEEEQDEAQMAKFIMPWLIVVV